MAILIITLVGVAAPMFTVQPTVATIATLALQLVHGLPQTKWMRGWWTLAAQAALFPWSEPKGFLAASVLLIVPGRVRWLAFGAVTVAAGLFSSTDFYSVVSAVMNAAMLGLIIFGLTRLNDLRSELYAARRELAAQSVADERERISRDLDTILGSALSAVIGLAGKRRPTEIAALARDAAARVRQVPVARPEAVPQADMTPRLALPILLSGLSLYVSGAVVFTVVAPNGPNLIGCAIVLSVVGLYIHHLLAERKGTRSRHVFWTLPLQTVLALVPLVYAEADLVHSLVALAAASALTVVPGRWAPWAVASAVVLAELLVLLAAKPDPFGVVILAGTIPTVAVTTMYYGLGLLTRFVSQVHETRLALAAIAVAKEHRRISADVHDLLGYGLSAITVKAELAARAPSRADAEFREIARMARRTLAELRTIAYNDPEISLHVEGASAREILTAAGVDVRLDVDTGLLDDQVDTLLATVLREAVTNILRHSRACSVTIQVVSTDNHVRLCVANDGAAQGTIGGHGNSRAVRHGGSGLINLTGRVAVAGGDLTAGPTEDDGYELVVTLPVPGESHSSVPAPTSAPTEV